MVDDLEEASAPGIAKLTFLFKNLLYGKTFICSALESYSYVAFSVPFGTEIISVTWPVTLIFLLNTGFSECF